MVWGRAPARRRPIERVVVCVDVLLKKFEPRKKEKAALKKENVPIKSISRRKMCPLNLFQEVEKVEQNQKDQKFDGHGAETLTPHHRGLP